jgi:hypothetical protein
MPRCWTSWRRFLPARDDMVDALALAFNQTAVKVSDMARWLALAS